MFMMLLPLPVEASSQMKNRVEKKIIYTYVQVIILFIAVYIYTSIMKQIQIAFCLLLKK